MESSEDKQWATKYLLDPLTAPEPADETGPGTHHTATPAAAAASSRKPPASASVSEKALASSTTSSIGYPTPPPSSRSERFPDFDGTHINRLSSTTATSSQIPTSTSGAPSTTTADDNHSITRGTRPRRTSSLQQRHPGDRSHRPLDMLRDDEKAAQRAPHLRKKQHIGADSIDSLDTITGSTYHHEGPYDAALMARNQGVKNAPIEAVARGNREALRATPKEKVLDSLNRHVPLDGTAIVPPGVVDRDGRIFRYAEGTDMMRDGRPEGGAYRRWADVQYSPGDLKGKGEPSYSLEKALKSHKRNVSETTHLQRSSYEMGQMPHDRKSSQGPPRPGMHHRSSSLSAVSGTRAVSGAEKYVDWERETSVKRSESGTGARLRKRMGSLKIRG